MNCRASIVALLSSWLGLPLCGQTLDAGIREVLGRLDEAFHSGDIQAYLDMFEPDHPGSHALLGQRLQRLQPPDAGAIGFRRESKIVSEPREIGPRFVVRVRHEIYVGDKLVAADLEDSVMAFRVDGARPIPTFVTDTPRQTPCPPGDKFRCPPCNYEIGGTEGWLCVPVGRDRSQSLEASSFYLLGTDLACDVSVRIDDSELGAIRLVEALSAALLQVEPTATAQLATAWLPPGAGKIPELTGSRVEIEIPGPSANRASVALFHVVQLGALQHLMLVRGSRRALTENRDSLDALLASFALLDADAERAEAAARARQFHVGGKIDGATYANGKYSVSMRGPEGWKAQQRCGGAAFRVVWTSPAGARLWLTGFSVPPGMSYWCDETADQWLRQLCAVAGLALPKKIDEWRADKNCDATARTIKCTVEHDKSQRLLRIAFREDLLIVVDGTAASDSDRQAVDTAIQTLRL